MQGTSDLESVTIRAMTRQPRPRHAGIVLAAGSGTRVGDSRNKVFLPLAGRRIVTRSLELFERIPGIDRLVLAVRAEDFDLAGEILASDLPFSRVDLVIGGATRHESEYKALGVLAGEIRREEIDIVLIHDAARPLTPVSVIRDVLDAAKRTGAAVPAVPLDDVAELHDGTGVVSGSRPSTLVGVQTPQAFWAGSLLDAHEAAAREGFTGTDTAACVERYGNLSVCTVPGHSTNLKVTYANDLFVAERLLAQSGHAL
jgi:2-C-methyl-D-erythritol 4-phosphate cytidylyltransferase